MFCINQWYYFTGALDKDTCNKIMKSASPKWISGKVGGDEENIDTEIRISDTKWTQDQWIYDTIWPWMMGANEQAGWKYDIKGAESMQITRYKKGGFYYFHRDGRGDHLAARNEHSWHYESGYVRKLSMVVLLNDNYEGGEFQFATYEEEKCSIDTPEFNKTGSIMVFPSDMEHRVTPVTKGIRYSLVIWFLGPPFK